MLYKSAMYFGVGYTLIAASVFSGFVNSLDINFGYTLPWLYRLTGFIESIATYPGGLILFACMGGLGVPDYCKDGMGELYLVVFVINLLLYSFLGLFLGAIYFSIKKIFSRKSASNSSTERV